MPALQRRERAVPHVRAALPAAAAAGPRACHRDAPREADDAAVDLDDAVGVGAAAAGASGTKRDADGAEIAAAPSGASAALDELVVWAGESATRAATRRCRPAAGR